MIAAVWMLRLFVGGDDLRNGTVQAIVVGPTDEHRRRRNPLQGHRDEQQARH